VIRFSVVLTHIPEKSTVFVHVIFKIQQFAIDSGIAPRRADHELHRAQHDASSG